MSGKNEVDGKTARACDGCVCKRARWYCAADDAFLCQSCDASVHLANPLARKHQRVRLKVSSQHLSDAEAETEDVKNISVPSWHHGFKRKPRSPRKPAGPQKPSLGPMVPELGFETSHEENYEEEEEQLLYRVPIYNPFGAAAELAAPRNAACDAESKEVKALLAGFGQDLDNMDGIINLPSDVDLAKFAADVESLLGGGGSVKIEDGEADVECHVGEGFEVNFDYDDSMLMTCWEDTKNVSVVGDGKGCEKGGEFENKKRKILLNLDYESVVLAWPSQRSPWTTGLRPEFDASEECWPDFMGTEMSHHHRHVYGEIGGRVMSQQAMGGREARVTRYREKRRTRLFSKKIRYEVRKLNAEKRPRMKGRFVKRASLFEIGAA